ncbi:MAG: hypothetical protein AB1505_05445 [Candidatus Latescibacterota bacterium]
MQEGRGRCRVRRRVIRPWLSGAGAVDQVAQLLESRARGGDLARAMADAPRKEGGFCALTLAWILKELKLDVLARAAGMPEPETQRLAAFRDGLVARIAPVARPSR